MSSTTNEPTVDALGNEIVIGNLYGYSRSSSGFSHTTIGRASSVKKDKVRLVNCARKEFIYGKPYEPTLPSDPPSDVSIRANMVFPVKE